jgi:uncharacterized membrane protein YdjX (TVP38/TMEM64 family)
VVEKDNLENSRLDVAKSGQPVVSAPDVSLGANDDGESASAKSIVNAEPTADGKLDKEAKSTAGAKSTKGGDSTTDSKSAKNAGSASGGNGKSGGWMQAHGITKSDVLKFSVLAALIITGIVLTIIFWPLILDLTSQEGIDRLTQTVVDTGPLAVLVLFALQILQVIVAFIPGEIVQIVAGVLYGPLWGSVIVLSGALISTIFIYYLVQKLGAPFVQKMVSEESRKKLDFITRTSRIDAIVFILFLIPGLPKDVITYLVALTDVRPKRFFLFSTIGRAPGVVASSVAGSSMANGNWTLVVIIFVVVVAVLVIAFFMRDRMMGKFNKFADDNPKGNQDEKDGR